MSLDQKHIDMIFREPAFYSEMSATENKVYTALYQTVNMLQSIRNKKTDTKLHVHPKDVNALISEIKTSVDQGEQKIPKKTTRELISKICTKFGIEKHNMASIISHIKNEAEKIDYNIEPFLKKASDYVKAIKKNSV